MNTTICLDKYTKKMSLEAKLVTRSQIIWETYETIRVKEKYASIYSSAKDVVNENVLLKKVENTCMSS